MANDRATKKQQELLSFIDGFIKGNGYGPSYREVMRALGYKSVSTVAAHVDALVTKGYLRKGDDYSARSIEVVGRDTTTGEPAHVLWLEKRVEKLFDDPSSSSETIAAYLLVLEDAGSSKVEQLRLRLVEHKS